MNYITSATAFAPHLIVQIEVVELSVCSEVLSVSVQGEVDVAAVALDDHRVPMIVIQQAAGGHGGVTQDGAVLIASWDSTYHKNRIAFSSKCGKRYT